MMIIIENAGKATMAALQVLGGFTRDIVVLEVN